MPRSLNSLAIRGAAPGVHGEVVIDAPDHVGGGEAGPHGRVVWNQASGAAVAGNGIAERDDAAGIAAFLGGAVQALVGAFIELAAFMGGDDGLDAEGLKEIPDAE